MKYVITLDTDTQLPRDAARQFVATMEHPLNRAQYDEGLGRIVEGHGDLLWDADGARVWAAHGFRSTCGGAKKFAAAMRQMEIPVILLQLVDEHFYHLDACFATLRPGAALVYPGAFDAESLAAIRSHIPRVYEVDREGALKFVCNGVSANGKFLTPALTHCVGEALAREGLEPIVLDTSEFLKSGGSVCCLKLFLD